MLLNSNISSQMPPSPEKTICKAIVVLASHRGQSLQKLHARVPVMTIITITPRPLIKLNTTETCRADLSGVAHI